MTREESGPSQWGWAFLLLLAVSLAALFRFYQLGNWPPGLYRDEAYNGLDALGVLQGDLRLFFPANNGREPLFIYLVALAVGLLGPTALAVRLPAAVVGTLTTIPTYLLGRDWFGRTTGILAAVLWATTFWPVHLSRIGLRVILLAPLLGLALWLGTRAYRTGRWSSWLAAGVVYGFTFYTYLAARFSPLLLVAIAVYLVLTGRRAALWSGGRSLWFLAGTALAILPLALVAAQDPALLLGRSGQVSILNPAVNGGDLWGTLWSQTARALGMFLWRGDDILRHNALLDYTAVLPQDNPAGRPVFDLFMAIPLLVGVGWCLKHWRRPPAAVLLLWQLTMLGPTILAEDTPHFLRAAGLLPGLVLLPAIGLNTIWKWPLLPVWVRRSAVVVLLAGSLALTARDYATYGRQPDVAYLFEDAAAKLATGAAADTATAAVYLDQRFWEGWPSIPFLLHDSPVRLVGESEPIDAAVGPVVRYVWPYGTLDAVGAGIAPPAVVAPSAGPLARGDLEPEPYSLYTRYAITPGAPTGTRLDNFDSTFRLRGAEVIPVEPSVAQVDLVWELAPDAPEVGSLPAVFLHVIADGDIVAQDDALLGGGLWPVEQWRPGIAVVDRHILALPEPLDPARHQIVAGLYWPDSQNRLPLLDSRYNPVDDQVTIWPNDANP